MTGARARLTYPAFPAPCCSLVVYKIVYRTLAAPGRRLYLLQWIDDVADDNNYFAVRDLHQPCQPSQPYDNSRQIIVTSIIVF